METHKVAVVTGSNKGIGLAIVRALCKQFNGDVYITSRDLGRGEAAADLLKKEGLNPKVHQLDIDDGESLEKMRDHLSEKYGGLDILVNNAAVAFTASTVPFSEQAEVTIKTNFSGTLAACQTLFPILRPHARVVNMSGGLAPMILGNISPEKRLQILSAKGIDDLKALMNEFVEDAKAGQHLRRGWVNSALGTSKVGISALSMIQQRHLDDIGKVDIVVNAGDPGMVQSEMSKDVYAGFGATPDQGAECPVYLALLPENVEEPRGRHVNNRKQIVAWN